MANTTEFNYNLDKITEREVVPDFVERLSIGNAFSIYINDGNKVIFNSTTKLKDGILANIIKTLNISDIESLDKFVISYVKVAPNSDSITIPPGKYYTASGSLATVTSKPNKIIQESTGLDVTDCFDGLTATLDVLTTRNDIYKAYWYKDKL